MKYPLELPRIAATEQQAPRIQTFSRTVPEGCDASSPAVTSSESPGSMGKSSPVSMKMITVSPT